MTDKKESTNTSFSQQQGTQVSNACERVQNAIGINNSTIAELNEDLVRKADEIAIKWRAYGLPYNAICDAVIEMAIWQKEQNQGYISKLEDICINLWDILDDIDTYSDLKIDDTNPNNPFKIIEEKTKKRHIFVQTDGYDLLLGNKKLVKKEDEH